MIVLGGYLSFDDRFGGDLGGGVAPVDLYGVGAGVKRGVVSVVVVVAGGSGVGNDGAL